MSSTHIHQERKEQSNDKSGCNEKLSHLDQEDDITTFAPSVRSRNPIDRNAKMYKTSPNMENDAIKLSCRKEVWTTRG